MLDDGAQHLSISPPIWSYTSLLTTCWLTEHSVSFHTCHTKKILFFEDQNGPHEIIR
jgi:hypothetical protein